MKKTDDFIANRIIWKAGHYKFSPTSTSFFKDLSLEIQQYLTNHLDNSSGIPILFFTKPTNEWTLLCTKQVICNDNQKIFRLDISQIKQLRPTLFDNISNEKSLNIRDSLKTEWHQVTVLDNKNDFYILHTDKGSDLFALWNILLMLIRFEN